MFFIFGISNGFKNLDKSEMIICSNCNRYGRINFFMRYSYISLFFIPVLKWGKKYYAKSSCCNGIFSVPYELGKKIERNEIFELDNYNIKFEYYEQENYYENTNIICNNCGHKINSNFKYCPKCGNKI